jgi:choline dehydrogenase-like flavoprotein
MTTFPGRRVADTDVIVVGAGAGGLAAAWRLTTRGARVILLEAGRHYQPDRDYPHDTDDFEARDFPYDMVRDEGGRPRCTFGAAQEVGPEWDAYRSWNAGQGRFAPGNTRQYLEYAHVRGVGGSTLAYQGEAHRLHPDSLRMRTLFGQGADWPLGYDELARYYDIAEGVIGIAGPDDNPFRPRPPVLPAHPLSYASQRLAPAFAAAGATLIPNHLAILSRPYDRRPPCNYCNSCTQGCPIGDKGSADQAFLPHALATGRLDLRPECPAVVLESGRDGRVTGVVYADREGTRHRVTAPFVVMAAGAVETPRLLLLSPGAAHPHGLGNGEGQVGRNLTELLFWSTVALLPERVDSFRGVPIDGSAWEHAVPRRGDGWVGGFRLATAHGAVNLRGPVAYAQRLVAGCGPAHAAKVAATFGHAVSLLAVGEWLPNPQTAVDLDPGRRDGTGQRLARITSWLWENERRLLRMMADTARTVVRTAGGEIVEEVSALDVFAASHVLGTCRMGHDRRTSVADRDGFCHTAPNLAIADGSLLPSSGAGDSPSLTITAMAIRTADRLIERSRTAA